MICNKFLQSALNGILAEKVTKRMRRAFNKKKTLLRGARKKISLGLRDRNVCIRDSVQKEYGDRRF